MQSGQLGQPTRQMHLDRNAATNPRRITFDNASPLDSASLFHQYNSPTVQRVVCNGMKHHYYRDCLDNLQEVTESV